MNFSLLVLVTYTNVILVRYTEIKTETSHRFEKKF